jgi:Concanavalin A-like lectin/glucanases superfamily/Domain of unknown function (DUF2341)
MKKQSRNMRNKSLKGLCALTLVLLTLCTGNALYTGGGSDTEVSGRIVTSNGKANAGVRVLLIPASYNPAFNDALSGINSDITDSAGTYRFTDVTAGGYNIQAEDPGNGNRFLISGIVVPAGGAAKVTDDSLRKPAALSVFLPDSISSVSGCLYVPGSLIFKYYSAGALTVNFDSVPQGLLPSIQYVHSGLSVAQTLFANVDVDTAGPFVLYQALSRGSAQRIRLNTTASGAGVAGNVYSFPVLVRLTKINFDFSKAKIDGSDIRFTKSDGMPLSYEIERWDASQGSAEIWVRIDTVFGNDSSRYFMMYWGNPDAASESNSTAVFDTTNGFQGVWHMGPAVNNMVPDATINHYDGTLSDTAPTATTGAIGICQQFNGMSNYIRMLGTASSRLNFPGNGTYSVSAWVYVDTLDTTYQKIIEKNNLQYKLQIDQFDNWSFSEYENAMEYELTNSAATAKTWVFLVGVRSGLQQYLYVNGVAVNSAITTLSYSKNRDTTTDLAIGKSAQSSYGIYFNGKIDEARVENRDHGADWILLCYMNQRPDDRLVVFRP